VRTTLRNAFIVIFPLHYQRIPLSSLLHIPFRTSCLFKGRIVGGEVASTAEFMKMPAQLRASASFMFDETKVGAAAVPYVNLSA
jgi:hypothetical protein